MTVSYRSLRRLFGLVMEECLAQYAPSEWDLDGRRYRGHGLHDYEEVLRLKGKKHGRKIGEDLDVLPPHRGLWTRGLLFDHVQKCWLFFNCMFVSAVVILPRHWKGSCYCMYMASLTGCGPKTSRLYL